MKKAARNPSQEANFRTAEIPTVRSSFSLPQNEYDELNEFLKSLQRKDELIGKSQLIRAAIDMARIMDRTDFIEALQRLEKRSPGRRAKKNINSQELKKTAEIKEAHYTDITDEQWKEIEPVFLSHGEIVKGVALRTPRDLRSVLNGIFYVLKMNARWMDIPKQYTSPSTANRAFKAWSGSELWIQICKIFYLTLTDTEKITWHQLLSAAMLDPQSIKKTRNRKKQK